MIKNKADFTASVIDEKKLSNLKDSNIDAKLIDVANDSTDDTAKDYKDYDKVLFSIGTAGKYYSETTINVDLNGTIKSMIAAKEIGVKHYYMVSTWNYSKVAVDNPDYPIKTYTIAKNYANLYLKNKSGLTYTIIHKSTLNYKPGQESIEV